MARPSVRVRDATEHDLPELLAMWRELQDLGSPYERSVARPSEPAVLARLRAAQEDPAVRVLVATSDYEPVGMAVLTHQPFAALFDAWSVHVHYLHVRVGHRRRGVGRALVAATAAHAEALGAEHVMTSVATQLRETQRFYARLGFAPLVVRRVAPTAVLRRRLASDRPGASAVEVLARRRSVRSRTRLRESVLRVTE